MLPVISNDIVNISSSKYSKSIKRFTLQMFFKSFVDNIASELQNGKNYYRASY